MASRLESMRNNPRGDWRIEDVEAVCGEYGVLCSAPRGGGSHYKVAHPRRAEKTDHPLQTPDQAGIYPEAGRFHRRREQSAMSRLEYPVVVEPLPADEGGGFVATVPDLPGCMSDGDTPEEALANVQDAIATWIEAANDLGHVVPKPSRRLALTA